MLIVRKNSLVNLAITRLNILKKNKKIKYYFNTMKKRKYLS